MDDWDKILSDVALEETRDEFEDEWWCRECEYGPMNKEDGKCQRCGAKNNQYVRDELDGWEDPDIDVEVEEIF